MLKTSSFRMQTSSFDVLNLNHFYIPKSYVKSHIDWEGERSMPYKGAETFPLWSRFDGLGPAKNKTVRPCVCQSGQYPQAGAWDVTDFCNTPNS